jgi:hypothetical protein
MPLAEPSVHVNVGDLVNAGREMKLAIGREHIDDIAAIAYALAQDRVTRRGGVLPARLARAYEALDDNERAALRNSVRDVTVALVLLGYLDLPSE